MRHMFLIAVAFVALAATAGAQSGSDLSGGNGTLYSGAFPSRILVIDEATMEVTEEIPVTVGIPRAMTLSLDRTRLYMRDAMYENVEIIDLETRRTVDTFTLSEGNKKVRIRGYQVDPLHRFMILLTRAATRHIDRYEIGPMELLQYDLAEHRVIRTIPWPGDEERERANLLFSPAGDLLYFFSDNDVLIFETENFTQVDKWELSQPLEAGFGPLGFGFSLDAFNEEPGFFTGLFRMRDPVQKRRLMGVARINLAEKSVDFYALGPSPAASVSFALAPGRRRAYGFLRAASGNIAPVPPTELVGRYELWTFDLENRRLHERKEISGRPRMGLKVSSNGKLLYVFRAGSTIDIYDAATYTHQRRVQFDGDMTTDLIVVPPEG